MWKCNSCKELHYDRHKECPLKVFTIHDEGYNVDRKVYANTHAEAAEKFAKIDFDDGYEYPDDEDLTPVLDNIVCEVNVLGPGEVGAGIRYDVRRKEVITINYTASTPKTDT
ncbi:MAG: hypothetical protein DRR06_19490 [Gammaproteobacteria bacterium]|nr:MAG: hypothetical protein DRR06_19490 [Gammaproteobacteria bacterium]